MIVTFLMIWCDVGQFKSGPRITKKKKKKARTITGCDTSCPRFLCCASQTYTIDINNCVWFLHYQGYENCALEFIGKLKMEDDYTDKDNNLDVFAYGFPTSTFGLSFPLLLPQLNGMLATHGWNEKNEHGMSRRQDEWMKDENIFL